MIKRVVHGTEQGPDHRAIDTVFHAAWPAPQHLERLLLKKSAMEED